VSIGGRKSQGTHRTAGRSECGRKGTNLDGEAPRGLEFLVRHKKEHDAVVKCESDADVLRRGKEKRCLFAVAKRACH